MEAELSYWFWRHRESILNFRIGFLSSIGGRLPYPCLPTPFPILRFFSQTFRAFSRDIPAKSRDIPQKKKWFPWFRGTYRTFGPPPLHVEDPHPTRKYPDAKVWVWVPFSCLKWGGAKRIVRFWEGKSYHRASPPKPVLEASESGIRLVCALFLQGE